MRAKELHVKMLRLFVASQRDREPRKAAHRVVMPRFSNLADESGRTKVRGVNSARCQTPLLPGTGTTGAAVKKLGEVTSGDKRIKYVNMLKRHNSKRE
jgi:hypothetical protein